MARVHLVEVSFSHLPNQKLETFNVTHSNLLTKSVYQSTILYFFKGPRLKMYHKKFFTVIVENPMWLV